MANNEMNQADIDSETESVQQMEELPLLSQQQQQQMEDDKVTIDMKEIISDCGDGTLSPECCIYRVPLMLRQHNEKAYTPKIVSIGPFHYGNERLQDMERHKHIMFKRFTHKVGSSLDDLVRLVKHLEPKIRASYFETINLTEPELVKMTLMDASFIIELFSMSIREICNDAKLSLSSFWTYIFEDLLLLENQLPFFVIEELFNKAFPHNRRGILPSFLELTYGFFKYYNLENLKPNTADVKIKHFTDLLRLFYLQGKVSHQRESFSMVQFESHILSYNANALQEAGIKLKASTSKCLLDLKFSRYVLEIPQISVQDSTELVFRNMIALEQCLYPNATYISDYVLVLDCLIDTQKDVDLLVRKKIVGNFIGDANNVASLFNGLGKNVLFSTLNSEYLNIFQRLNRYCEDPWHKMKATLKRDYCRTPWQIVASIAAIVLLFLTIIQTVFSILQVVK